VLFSLPLVVVPTVRTFIAHLQPDLADWTKTLNEGRKRRRDQFISICTTFLGFSPILLPPGDASPGKSHSW
jgi:hypothetical protein